MRTTMYCLNCGYVLDGLPEDRCPECGTAFDPTDSSTVHRHGAAPGRPPGSPRLVTLRIELWAALCLFVIGIFTLSWTPQGYYDYLVRCTATSVALFLYVDPLRQNKRLTSFERVLCLFMFILLVILVPTFVGQALQVRQFSNR